MKHDPSALTEDEALAIIAKHKAKMAKRGIRYDGSASPAEVKAGDNPFLIGPQTELDYRRMLKEMDED
jgi:hypothetical protein